MENIIEETKNIIKKYGIRANKNLGQNFLIDEDTINTIVESAEIKKEDCVIEIGPGLGTLTKELVKKAGKVICIELDSKMISILKDRFSEEVTLINQDVLKVNLKELIEEQKKEKYTIKIVANLPYYITTPIVMKLLEERLDIESITIMIQKEVAERLACIPGEKETGAITYSVYYFAEVKKIKEVPNTSFIPEPEVTSEVIQLSIRKEPVVKVKNEKLLFQLIKVAFMQRRKTLQNALSHSTFFENKQQIKQILEKLQLDEKVRGEELTIEQFAKIANQITKQEGE